MSIRVTKVEPMANAKLRVSFSDGTSGVADLSEHTTRKPFLALADADVFNEALVEHGAVEWPRGDVGIATEALYALVHGLPRPRTGEQVRANELEVSLRELRQLAGRTQAELAEEGGITQSALSQFEAATDHKLSALRAYVERMGWNLEVVAVRGDRRLTLRGV